MWGYSFALSDVRVTLANGAEFDCLQKNPSGWTICGRWLCRLYPDGLRHARHAFRTPPYHGPYPGMDSRGSISVVAEDARRVFAMFPERGVLCRIIYS